MHRIESELSVSLMKPVDLPAGELDEDDLEAVVGGLARPWVMRAVASPMEETMPAPPAAVSPMSIV